MDYYLVLLKEWQTLGTGIIGFAAVILTLVVNAALGRKQQNEQRCHEREVLRSSLVEELKIQREALQGNVEEMRAESDDPQSDWSIPLDRMDDVFQANLSRLGLLSTEEVSKVIEARFTARTYQDSLIFFGAVPHERSDKWLIVPRRHTGPLIQKTENLAATLDGAMNALSNARYPNR